MTRILLTSVTTSGRACHNDSDSALVRSMHRSVTATQSITRSNIRLFIKSNCRKKQDAEAFVNFNAPLQ